MLAVGPFLRPAYLPLGGRPFEAQGGGSSPQGAALLERKRARFQGLLDRPSSTASTSSTSPIEGSSPLALPDTVMPTQPAEALSRPTAIHPSGRLHVEGKTEEEGDAGSEGSAGSESWTTGRSSPYDTSLLERKMVMGRSSPNASALQDRKRMRAAAMAPPSSKQDEEVTPDFSSVSADSAPTEDGAAGMVEGESSHPAAAVEGRPFSCSGAIDHVSTPPSLRPKTSRGRPSTPDGTVAPYPSLQQHQMYSPHTSSPLARSAAKRAAASANSTPSGLGGLSISINVPPTAAGFEADEDSGSSSPQGNALLERKRMRAQNLQDRPSSSSPNSEVSPSSLGDACE